MAPGQDSLLAPLFRFYSFYRAVGNVCVNRICTHTKNTHEQSFYKSRIRTNFLSSFFILLMVADFMCKKSFSVYKTVLGFDYEIPFTGISHRAGRGVNPRFGLLFPITDNR